MDSIASIYFCTRNNVRDCVGVTHRILCKCSSKMILELYSIIIDLYIIYITFSIYHVRRIIFGNS